MTPQPHDHLAGHRPPESAPPHDAASLSLIFGHVPAFIWKYSPAANRFLYASDYVTELAGLDRDALLRDAGAWAGRLDGDGRTAQALAAMREAMREGRPYVVRFRFATAHHGSRWFKSAAQPAVEDGELFYYGCTTDVTAQHEAEEALRRRTTALEQADEAFIITDAAGRIEYVNDAFARMTGYSREEAIGNRPSMLKSGRQDETFYRDLWQTIARGKPWRGRFINRRKDGSLFEQWATIAPLREEDGVVAGFVAVQLDMTHQLDLERRLARAERLASVGEAIAGAAHTLKNILNTMKAGAFLVQQAVEAGNPEKLRQVWQIFIRNTERLDHLTGRMLDFVRNEPLDLEPLDLNALAQEVVEASRAPAALAGVNLKFEPAGELPGVPCDRTAMHDAVLNLVSNAIEACAERGCGCIRLATRLDESAQAVELAVEDDGPGIPPEIQAQIFQPFFTTKGHKGNGLGLAMVQKTILAHSGTIDAKSAPGRTRFTIRLPL